MEKVVRAAARYVRNMAPRGSRNATAQDVIDKEPRIAAMQW